MRAHAYIRVPVLIFLAAFFFSALAADPPVKEDKKVTGCTVIGNPRPIPDTGNIHKPEPKPCLAK